MGDVVRLLRGVGCHNETVRVARRAREALAEHAHQNSDCPELARISSDVAGVVDDLWYELDDYRTWLSRMMDCLRAGILDPNRCWAFVDNPYGRDARQCSLMSWSYCIPDTHIYQVCHIHAKSCPASWMFRRFRRLEELRTKAEIYAEGCGCGEEQPEEDDARTTYVYVMAQGDRRKVGMSVSPTRRCNTIRLASGLETGVLWTEPHPDRTSAAERESELHARFADHRLQGEWFRAGPVDAWLEAL